MLEGSIAKQTRELPLRERYAENEAMTIAARAESAVLRCAFALAVRVVRMLVKVLQACKQLPKSSQGNGERFAVVSHATPGMWSGQAMVLERLLRELPESLFIVISSSRPTLEGRAHNMTFVLAAEPFERKWCKPGLQSTMMLVWRLVLRGFRITKILCREQCSGVVACSGDLIDLPAAALACRVVGIRLVPYYFDDYVSQWSWAPAARARAESLEPLMLREAINILVPNERLRDTVTLRTGKTGFVIRNPAWSSHVCDPVRRSGSERVACRIVYTGAVYHINFAAFRCLIASFAELSDLKPELHVYTAQDPIHLAQEGIHGPQVTIFPHLPPGLAWGKQCEASVLFMGFAFDDSLAPIVSSSAPGKLGDYLASGVPIVALAPRDSFIADFFVRHECGELVDRTDHHALAAAIRTVVLDTERRGALITHGLICAQREFTASAAVSKLLQSLRHTSQAG